MSKRKFTDALGEKKAPNGLFMGRVTPKGRVPSADEIACCLRKRRYRNKQEAFLMIRREILMYSVRNYAYRCPYCLGYHLTHKKDYTPKFELPKARRIVL